MFVETYRAPLVAASEVLGNSIREANVAFGQANHLKTKWLFYIALQDDILRRLKHSK